MRSVVCAVAALGAVMGWSSSLTAAPAGTATIGLVASGEASEDHVAALAAIVAEVERRMEAARDPVDRAICPSFPAITRRGHHTALDQFRWPDGRWPRPL